MARPWWLAAVIYPEPMAASTASRMVMQAAVMCAKLRRHSPQPRRERGPALNLTHFGLALTG
jgi:hypothetical protein